jgi:hypothetical protein
LRSPRQHPEKNHLYRIDQTAARVEEITESHGSNMSWLTIGSKYS